MDWISFLAYPNLFGINGFVVVVTTYNNILLGTKKKGKLYQHVHGQDAAQCVVETWEKQLS
jgi:hypothetical protein